MYEINKCLLFKASHKVEINGAEALFRKYNFLVMNNNVAIVLLLLKKKYGEISQHKVSKASSLMASVLPGTNAPKFRPASTRVFHQSSMHCLTNP